MFLSDLIVECLVCCHNTIFEDFRYQVSCTLSVNKTTSSFVFSVMHSILATGALDMWRGRGGT